MRHIIFILFAIVFVFSNTCIVTAQTREQLEAELKRIEEQIQASRTVLESKRTERQSLERDVSILDTKVREAQLSLKQRDMTIASLASDIASAERTIANLTARTERGRDSLAQLLRKANEAEEGTLVELILRGDSFAAAFTDADRMIMVRNSLNETIQVVEETKNDVAEKRDALENKQSEHEQLRLIQAREKAALEAREAEKRSIVKQAKGQEKVYEAQIKAQELSAAEIRNALFSLRDSTSAPVSFGTMYAFAKEASGRTGVRPSMILAILTEESNLGKNVGKGTWTVDMHPTRDRPVFKEICAELGFDPDKMPVSKKPWYGWGGAMGPGQFIPSTWKQIAPRVERMLGTTTANPWDPRTATYATAIYLMDAGADKQTRAAERLAAQRYLAGWANANKPAYQFYGNEVMELVDKYDRQIDVLAQ